LEGRKIDQQQTRKNWGHNLQSEVEGKTSSGKAVLEHQREGQCKMVTGRESAARNHSNVLLCVTEKRLGIYITPKCPLHPLLGGKGKPEGALLGKFIQGQGCRMSGPGRQKT